MIAPIFAPENADFASANQDVIRQAMAALTPFQFRPIGYGDHHRKGRSDGRTRPDIIMRAMKPRKKYIARDLGEAVGMTSQQVAVAMKDLLKTGRVKRVTGPYQRPAVYVRPK